MNFAGGLTLFAIPVLVFGTFYLSQDHHAAAETWYIYEGQMPKPWENQFGDVLYEATKYWEERMPGTKFYRTQFVDDADFALQWASQFEGTRLGYYTPDTNNDYGKPYVAISLGYMTGDSFQNKKFNLVDPEYALAITTHELGHAIGLRHSDDPSDIMYPTLDDYQDWLKEHPSKTTDSDDSIQPIQAKYLLYENKDYGFSIDYPTGWYVDDEIIREEGFINYVQFSPEDRRTTTFIDVYKILNDSEFRDLSTEQYLEKMVSSLEERCNNATYDNDNYVCSDFEELYSDTMVDDYGNTWHFATTNEHNAYLDGYETDTATILYEMPYGDDTWAIRMILDDDAFNQFNSADEVDDFIKTVTTSFVLTDTSSNPDTEDKPTPAKPVTPSTQPKPTTPTTKTTDNGGGCLIATATYGSELAPQIQLLREIRDNTVMSTKSGTSFMTAFNTFYYSFSPTVADLERQNPVFKESVKITITPLLSTLSILNYVDIDSESEMLGYGISIILLNIGMYFVAPTVVIAKTAKLFKNKIR